VGEETRKLIAIRLDSKVLGWLRETAEKKGLLSVARQPDLGGGNEEGKLALE